MQRIPTIVQKITDLVKQEEKNTVIDIDLMLDYTRVLYADLLEWRSKLAFTESLTVNNVTTPKNVPQQEPIVTNEPERSTTLPETKHMPVAEPHIHAHKKTEAAPERTDLRNLIGINDKYQFISELFGNNKEAYEASIAHINTCATMQQALGWLDEHAYKQHFWNEDGEAVQSFYGILTGFFTER